MSYDAAAATAQRLIAEKGRAVILRRATAGAYSPASDSFSGAASVDHPVKAVFTAYKTHEIDGEAIKRTDKKVLIAGFAPQKDDQIIDGAQTIRILDVDTIQPGDLPILWKAQGRI